MPHPMRAGGGRPPSRPGLAQLVLAPAAAFGPLPAGVGLEVGRPELVHTKDDFRLAVLGYDLAVGDGVEVLDVGLLGRVRLLRTRLRHQLVFPADPAFRVSHRTPHGCGGSVLE